MSNLTLTSAPANEIITATEAKDFADIETTDDDTLIATLIDNAIELLQSMTRRQFITATYTLTFHDFPTGLTPIVLPKPNLQSVTSITYNDADGNSQTFASTKYSVDTKAAPAKIYLKEGQSYPDTENDINSVTITFVCGYGDDATDVPYNIKLAALMIVRHWYYNREALMCPTLSANIEFTVKALIKRYTVVYCPEGVYK